MQWNYTYPSLNEIIPDNENKDCKVFRDSKNNKIIGTVSLNQVADEQYEGIEWKAKGEVWIIHRVAIHPDYQKQGYGTKICEHSEDYIRAKGGNIIRLDAFSKNPYSNRIYQKLAYLRLPELLYFHGNPEPFYVYQKVLKLDQ